MAKLLPYLEPGRIEAGCDEAGRGCLAGPVVAAAVVLDEETARELALDDSKKLSAKKRDKLRVLIEEKALAWAVSFVSNDKIDEINIFVHNKDSSMLNGIQVDFKETLMGGGFQIENPNADRACGCGQSFG